MKTFCSSLREHAKNIIDFERKKMLPLTKEELKSHQHAKVYYICKKRIKKKNCLEARIIRKLENIVTIQVNIEVQQIAFVI